MPKHKDVEFSKKLELGLESFFLKKLPGLSSDIKEMFVNMSPWIVLVAIIFSLPILAMALGLWSLVPLFYLGYQYHFGYNISWWISILATTLMVLALPGLFKRKIIAWKLMYYSSLVMAFYYLVSFSLGSLIVVTGISMYILFQIKSYYK